MDIGSALQSFLTIFATVLLAEIGDKTQLATLLYATDPATGRWLVFAASSLALICAAGLAVLAGGWLAEFVSPRVLRLIAGAAFILVGIWTIFS